MHGVGEPALLGERYELRDLLGRGGMGAVYRALDTSTGEVVALKRMSLADDGTEVTEHDELRFRREFHTLARLEHPRIVEAYDFGIDGGSAYYTMELLDGQDLRPPMRPEEACRVMRDIASALAFLHAKGLVHRDLKPRNVRVGKDGDVKLIDFGVLATVGTTADVAGTPSYTAPETVYGRLLDGRTDLYALGVLGYVLLTARPPYPVKSFKKLREVWRDPVVPPSTFAPAVSKELDELVLEMLCLNPLGRPPSAAVVVDRLTGIGDLGDNPDIDVQRGYLASAAMVGRRREMASLRTGIEQAAHGGRAVAFVEAPSGTGKSRLVRELALEAKLAGAVVASASCEQIPRTPYGLVSQLVVELHKANPKVLEHLATDDMGTLVRVLPWLGPLLPRAAKSAPVNDPGEERMRVQRILGDWLSAIATSQMIVIFVDDIQRADEASAAVLAALARNEDAKGLYLVVALRTQEPVRAPSAVSALAEVGRRVSLGGLDEQEIQELVRSFFGDVQHTARLARWMHEFTEGSPLLCAELARHFVDEGLVRYQHGEWVLPIEIKEADLPKGLTAALAGRAATLSAAARRVGEVLAIHGGTIAVRFALQLAEGDDEGAFFDAIGELVQAGFVLEANDNLRFRHDGYREALLGELSDERKAALHLRVGRALVTRPDAGERSGEIGWHLLDGGEEDRGARLLEKAGFELYDAQALMDCLAPLEAANRVYKERGTPLTRRMHLLYMLTAAGWVADREVGARYQHEAVHAFWEHSGIALAARLGKYLGKHLALVVGIAFASLRWLVVFWRPRGPAPTEAIMKFSVVLGYACGLTYSANRREEVDELVALVDPLGVFEKRMPYAAYLGMQVFPAILIGRLGHGDKLMGQALDIIETDKLTPTTDWELRFAEAGIRGLRVIIDVNQFNPRLDDDLRRIDELGFRYYNLVVQTARVVRHRYRGEEDLAREVERQMEEASLQLGSWSTDLQILLFAHPAFAMSGDTMGLRRCGEEIERFISEGFRFEDRRAMIQGEYERLRGRLDSSRRALEDHAAKLDEDNYLMRQWHGSALAATELAAGNHERAAELARAVIALGDSDDHGVVLPWLRAHRILGLALQGMDDTAEAITVLERAITHAEERDCPMLAGQLHEARARVAFDSGDRLSYEVHCAKAQTWLEPTNNPHLISMHERLLRLGRGDHSGPGEMHSEAPSGSYSEDQETYELPSARRRNFSDTQTRRH